MNGLFLLSGAIKWEPAIDGWLDGQVPELGAIAHTWFNHMRHVKVKPGIALNTAALSALITAAYADIKLRLAAN